MGSRACVIRCGVIVALFAALHVWAGLAVPALTGRVVDQADILSQAGEQRLADRIRELEQATGGQMAILIIPSLDGDSLESFSLRVAESWKIGRKDQDNGALLLISLQDHKIRLEIGYGWEGPISDARAGDIIRSTGPYFRRREYTQGIEFAIGEVRRMVIGGQGVGSLRKELGDVRHAERSATLLLPVMATFVGVVVLVLILSWVTARRGWYVCYGTPRTSPDSDSGRYGNPRARDYGWPTGHYGGGSSDRTGGGGGYSGGGGRFGGGGASGGW